MSQRLEKIDNIRGTYDLTPPKSERWTILEDRLIEIVRAYGYQNIRLPLMEQTSLFKRSIGEVTDIVEKEMYTFNDRDKHSLTLRPEGTASCVRAGIQHSMFRGETPRLWYLGPMFRHERPQKGRYRQFYQLGCEAFGMAGPELDVELIQMTAKMWDALGISHLLELQINSLGELKERNAYKAELVTYLQDNKSDLDEESQRRLDTNPLRILDSKDEKTQEIVVKAPKLIDYIDDDSRAHFEVVCERLTKLGVSYRINPALVRGLDYYNRTVFEWVTQHLGAQGTVCAGGRYDGLVAQLGGESTPGFGFAMGLERLYELVDEHSSSPLPQPTPGDVYLVSGSEQQDYAWKVATHLREHPAGIRVIMHCAGGNFKKQLKKADKSGAPMALILGEEEEAKGEVSVKFLRESKEQVRLPLSDLPTLIKKELDASA